MRRKHGGIDYGKPGERPEYVEGYYAAFVLDPLGNNVVAFHFSPVWMLAKMAAKKYGVYFGAVAVGLAGLAVYRFSGWF